MWTEKTKSGKFKHVERYTDPLTGKEKKISVTTEKNTAQARKMAQRALVAKIDSRLNVAPIKDITWGELCDRWLDAKKHECKATTYFIYECEARNVVKLLGYDTLVSSFSANFIRQQIIYPEGSSVNHLRYFKLIMKWGYLNDYVDNIQYLDKLQRTKKEEKEDSSNISSKYLESWEVAKLLPAIRKDDYRDLTHFLVLTGMRLGEALSVTASDIDLKQRYIYVNSTYSYNVKTTDTPKTKSSNRRIYIQTELFPLCQRLKKVALINQFVYKTDLLFQRSGKHLCPTNYRFALGNTAKNVLHKHVYPHMLRHTHTSLLAEQGVDIETISRRLGHENSDITRQIYLHVTEKMRSKDNDAIRNIKIL